MKKENSRILQLTRALSVNDYTFQFMLHAHKNHNVAYSAEMLTPDWVHGQDGQGTEYLATASSS